MIPRVSSILAIGAHPDDIEIGCGATLARFREQGTAIHLVSLCDTGDIPTGAPVAEWESAMAVFAPTSHANLGFRNRNLHEDGEALRGHLERLRDTIAPSVVFTHAHPDLHQDHEAARVNIERVFRGASILGFENLSSLKTFTPHVFCAVEERHMRVKIDALGQYASQANKAYFTAANFEAIARLRGAQCRSDRAEAFEVVRLVW